jgi:hypothetical protein
MPLDIEFTTDGRGVILDHSGDVDGNELASAIRKIHENEKFMAVSYWISDRTNCTSYNVDSAQVASVAEQTRLARAKNPHLLVALVSTSALQFGISRMLQSLTDKELTTTTVCDSREKAEAWIEANLSDTQ